MSGLFAGLAGVLIAARLNSAQPSLGLGYELDAIAAAVIGGTSLSGGEGTILGTVIGAFIISTLTNGLRILSVPQEWQTVVTGAIVILAVYLDIVRRRRRNYILRGIPAAPEEGGGPPQSRNGITSVEPRLCSQRRIRDEEH